MSAETGLVSVIMPLYNAERYVTAAARSVLEQTYRHLELVVVDDGSTDRGPELVRALGDDRVRVVTQPNGGEAAARNAGLDLARGEYIAWQDADDLSLPTLIETSVAAMRSTGAGYSHCDMLLIDSDGVVRGLWQSSNMSKERLLPFLLRVGTPYNNCSMVISVDAIRECRFDLAVGYGTDTDFVAQFGPTTLGVHVPEPLVLYRRHSSSLSTSVGPAQLQAHVEQILARHPLDRFVPEAWMGRNGRAAQVLANCLVSLHLSRRGLVDAAAARLEKAMNLLAGHNIEPTALAVANLVAGNLDGARSALAQAPGSDPVAANYRGELAAIAGDTSGSYEQFTRALALAPDYEEPVINLAALGGGRGLNLVTPYWQRYPAA